jgi:hypothetical protein
VLIYDSKCALDLEDLATSHWRESYTFLYSTILFLKNLNFSEDDFNELKYVGGLHLKMDSLTRLGKATDGFI